jgi:hypothetical protein
MKVAFRQIYGDQANNIVAEQKNVAVKAKYI